MKQTSIKRVIRPNNKIFFEFIGPSLFVLFSMAAAVDERLVLGSM